MPIVGPQSNQQISDDAVRRMKQDMLPLAEAAAKVEGFSERMDEVEQDVSDAVAAVNQINPGVSPAVAQYLRANANDEPSYIEADVFSPFVFNGVGDGVTDDVVPLKAAILYLKNRGRSSVLHLGGKRWYSSETLVIDFPIVIDGGGMGIGTVSGTGNQSDIPFGGEIVFPAGVSGLLLDKGSWGWTMRDVSITSQAGGATPPSSDVGIEFRSGRGTLSNVMVRRFSKGVWINGTGSGYNANCSSFTALRVRLNRGHGLHLQGSDANANTFVMLDAMQNAGYGVLDESDAQNKYYGPHFNSNTLAAMHLKTRSAAVRDPYSEGGNRIEIDTTVSQDIRIECASYYAGPEIWSGPTGNITAGFGSTAVNRGCTLVYGRRHVAGMDIEAENGNRYRFRTDSPNTGNMSIYGVSENQNIISFRSDGSMASGVGFHGSNPKAKPTITGSRGGNAALASLLTQLASYGLITDSTTA